MTSWLERARALFQVTADGVPDKTDKTLVSSVLSVPSDKETKTEIQASSVFSVQDGALAENKDLLEELMAAAMHCCDVHGDSTQARAQMREEVMATPQELQADLLEHFKTTYGDVR